MKGRQLTEQELAIQTCNEQHGLRNFTETSFSTISSVTVLDSDIIEEQNTQKPKDYTVFLAALTGYIALFNLSMIFFFNSPFKRTLANKDEPTSK